MSAADVATHASRRGLRRRGRARRGATADERRTGYLMVLPTVLLVGSVAFFPVAYSFWLSLHNATITGTGSWAGFENYSILFDDPAFREGLVNTSLFTSISVALELVIGMLIALGLNQSFRGRGLTRTAILLPWVFPVVVSALMWRLMLQDDVGVVTYVAHSLHLTDGSILSNRGSLMTAAILIDVWKETPFMALLLLAGLQTIPGDVIDASKVDGAGAVRRFFGVTLPLVTPAILVALLFRTLQAWSVYDLFWVMSDRELESLSTYVYKGVRVSQLDFAPGTAAAVLTFLGALLLSLFFIRLLGSRGGMEEI
jgi:trehalose/maltose transport system permease protein